MTEGGHRYSETVDGAKSAAGRTTYRLLAQKKSAGLSTF
jgi:hypothetical protein